MSLLHNWRTTYNTSTFRGISPWSTTFLYYRDKHIYILITYSQITGESLDANWLESGCWFHKSNCFPMYYRSRSKIFQERALGNVVDK